MNSQAKSLVLLPPFAKGGLGEISIGIALLALSAKIQVPMWPVPVTLQTLAVMILGLYFPKNAARSAILAYIGLGVAGVPLLAGPLTLPRLGYLAGFILAVEVMLRLRESLEPVWVCFAGYVCIYVPGIAWLSVYLGAGQAVMLGFVPFIVPELVKIGLLRGFHAVVR